MNSETNLDEELLSASKEGDGAAVRQALKAGANIDAVDFNGQSSCPQMCEVRRGL